LVARTVRDREVVSSNLTSPNILLQANTTYQPLQQISVKDTAQELDNKKETLVICDIFKLMKKLLPLAISIILAFQACGYVEESHFIVQSSTGNDFFDENWNYRQPVIIDNTANSSQLQDYQINLTIESINQDFWDGVENDGRSVRFTDSDKSTILYFWTEKFDYSGQSASFWIEVPQIPASFVKTIYLYYGNSSAVSASSGLSTFVFFDDFEDADVGDWSVLSSGGVQSSADPAPPPGSSSNFSIEKINNSDPNGGYKPLATAISTASQGYILDGRIYRPDPYGGGAADRLAVESSANNGYGFIINHTGGTNYIAIEERSSGTGTTIGSSVTFDPDENSWYKFSFHMKPGGVFDFFYLDMDGNVLKSVLGPSDATVSSFNIVAIRGGYEFYVDDIRMRLFTDPEPAVSTGVQETH
jgi:hypothetical protein